MKNLLDDLSARVNPERSRRFSSLAFEEGLERIQREARGIERRFAPFRPLRIAIVGTNGKGSVAFALEQCFREGLKLSPEPSGSRGKDTAKESPDENVDGVFRGHTGLYTSPHLLHFTERIRVDGDPVSLSRLEQEYDELQTIAAEDLEVFTYFEFLTLLAFRLFLSLRLPVQIFEAGLGGRLDATKIARADAVLLTNIGLDHTALLGHTRRKILKEKLGIIDEERSRLLYLADPNIPEGVIRPFVAGDAAATSPHITYFSPRQSMHYLDNADGFARFVYEDLRRRLGEDGPYRLLPAQLRHLPTLPESFALRPPPGRFEIRQNARQTFIFDNAHNPAAVFRFLADFRRLYPLHETSTGRAEPDGVESNVTGAVVAILADRRTAPLRSLLRHAKIQPVLQLCREGFAPPDPDWTQLPPAAGEVSTGGAAGGISTEGEKGASAFPVHSILESLHTGPLTNCRIILFLGSHRLYDLFDRVTGEERAIKQERPRA